MMFFSLSRLPFRQDGRGRGEGKRHHGVYRNFSLFRLPFRRDGRGNSASHPSIVHPGR
jgi:hypothetical protein